MALIGDRMMPPPLIRWRACLMWMNILRAVIAGIVVAAVTAIAKRFPRIGALILTLPLVSILAIFSVWAKDRDIQTISRLSRETLILVPLGLPFFLPLAFAQRIGIGFWAAFGLGLVLATIAIGTWFWLAPQTS